MSQDYGMTEKVFINQDNTATFVCPSCQRAKAANVEKYKNLDKAIWVTSRCSCGHVWKVILERRKSHRRTTKIEGVYFHRMSNQKLQKGKMTVEDVSRSGLRIRLENNQMSAIGDKLMVEFNLDDRANSLIKKEVVIRNMSGCHIGAEFCSKDDYDRAIGFYLFN